MGRLHLKLSLPIPLHNKKGPNTCVLATFSPIRMSRSKRVRKREVWSTFDIHKVRGYATVMTTIGHGV